MNWLDFALIGGLLIALMLGSKIGLIRSTMRFFALAAGIIITTNNSDIIAIEIARHLDASPMVIAIISFAILLAVMYGVFRLVVYAFYKVSKLQSLGSTDKIGGALMGAVRGWVFFGFIFFLMTLLPMPDAYYRALDSSALPGPMMKSIPIIFNGVKTIQPESPSFVEKVENSLYDTNNMRFEAQGLEQNDFERQQSNEKVREHVVKIRKYFGELTTEEKDFNSR